MLLSSFRQVLTLSYGLLFSWSCLIFSWVVVVGVCDFENVKRYNVIMEERESSMARVVGLL